MSTVSLSHSTDRTIINAVVDALAESEAFAKALVPHLVASEEFKHAIGESITSSIDKPVTTPNIPTKLPLAIRHSHLDSVQAADELGIGRSTLQRTAARRLLRPIKVGNLANAYCRARVKELAVLMIAGKVTTAPQPPEIDAENIAHLDAYQARFGIPIPQIFNQADPRESTAKCTAGQAGEASIVSLSSPFLLPPTQQS